jgi:hypothetical protein
MGENRLLHILEPSKVIQEDSSSFFCSPGAANRNEINAICFALSRLRDDNRDLQLRIVQIGLFQIANYIFENGAQIVEGPRALLLLHLLQRRPDDCVDEEAEAHTAGSSFSDTIIGALLSTVVALPKFRNLQGKGVGIIDFSKFLERVFVFRTFILEEFDPVVMVRTGIGGRTQRLFDLLEAHRPSLVHNRSEAVESQR